MDKNFHEFYIIINKSYVASEIDTWIRLDAAIHSTLPAKTVE